MLPKFLQRGHIGDEWFFDYARGGWVQMGSEWAQPTYEEPEGLDEGEEIEGLDESAPTGATSLPEGESEPQVTAASVGADLPPLPKGITMITLDSPDRVVDVHNAIAEAVGEPRMPPSAKPFKRRF
jgi:hypothetical protein